MTNLDEVIDLAKLEINQSKSVQDLEDTRLKYFGKSGLINNEMKKISALNSEDKKIMGKRLNLFKNEFSQTFLKKKLLLQCYQDKIFPIER